MILTCPACATRYLTDPAVLGPSGRMVRCAKCAHSWMQTPPADMPRRVDLPPPPPPADPGARVNLPARLVPRAAQRFGTGSLLLAGIVLAVALSGAYVARERIVAAWPQAERVYATLGIRAVALGAGLRLDNVTFVRRRIDGEDAMVVEGHVTNVTDTAQPVPTLRATLRNDSNQWLTDWTFSLDRMELAPGESATFTTTTRNPPEASKRLSITFTEGPAGG
ncbi:MAG TPA: DUF3426 domain-containing protein [Dongiaceae bacterium]|nr:DUF3426 domain-containing protein [Dongiaceae bacterium]